MLKYLQTLLICVLLFMLKISSTHAQIAMSGRVVDAVSRQPLEYVAVMNINEPLSKTVTDQYGNFHLVSSSDSASLLVSYIGYQATTVHTRSANSNSITIPLQQDIVNLKDIVVLQSNNATKFSTLSKIDLNLKPVRNTQELFRLVPGLFIAQHAGGGKAEQIFLRGFDCDHGTDVQVSVDGMPVNMVSHAHGQGYADAHFIIPETVNSIDFAGGPYYAQQGNLNTAGYVTFSTYKNIQQSRIQSEAGSFNTLRTLAMIDLLKKNKDKQSAYIAAEMNYTDGPTISKQYFRRYNVFGKYNLSISNDISLSVSASSFSSNWDASGQVPDRAVNNGTIGRFGSIDPSEGGNTERHNANLKLAYRFANGTVWENQAYFSRYSFNLYSNFTFFLNDPVNGDEIQQAENRNIAGYLSKLSTQYFFNKWQLRSFYGTGVRYDATTGSKLSHVVKRQFLNEIQQGNIKETNAYAFMQQQWSHGKWLIDAGVRFDYFNFDYFNQLTVLQNPAQSKTIVSPKLNIQYSLHDKVQLYARYGKGFHSNDTRVVTANNGKEILPAAYGTDIGMIAKPTDHLFINVAAWLLHLNQEFVYVGDEGITVPGGKTTRAGIDIIARYQFSKKIFANINFNITKARAVGEAKGADYIPLAPLMTSTGGLFYKNAIGLNGSITYRYIKNRPANEDNSIVAKGYFLAEASLNYTMPEYEIGLAVENIFNVKWNEAQFATESRLKDEAIPVDELHYTPGTPFFARLKLAVFF
ncbi:MAG: TonB-dependent receptor [Chitinophagaceae bacterium]|nr:TonB-dependent receptor [Chitinophagaceae bacterium]